MVKEMACFLTNYGQKMLVNFFTMGKIFRLQTQRQIDGSYVV